MNNEIELLQDTLFKYKQFIKGKEHQWLSIDIREDDRKKIADILDNDFDLYSRVLESKAYDHLAQTKSIIDKILLHEDFTVNERMAIVSGIVNKNSYPMSAISYQDNFSGWSKPLDEQLFEDMECDQIETMEITSDEENPEDSFDIDLPALPINEEVINNVKAGLLDKLSNDNKGFHQLNLPLNEAQILSQMITNKEIILLENADGTIKFMLPDDKNHTYADEYSNMIPSSVILGKSR